MKYLAMSLAVVVLVLAGGCAAKTGWHCPDCRKPIAQNAAMCPNCGHVDTGLGEGWIEGDAAIEFSPPFLLLFFVAGLCSLWWLFISVTTGIRGN